MEHYRVYGKHKSMKQFKAFDMKENKFVGNLIYASTFTEDQKDDLQKEIDYMNDKNEQYTFEIRKV